MTQSIFVVDDHPDILDFMRAVLEGAGYEVRTAPEGEQALELMSARAADLIITDIFMPGLEGFETITRCKAEFPRTPLVAMSAGTVPGMTHDFLAAASLLGGVRATLRKPFSASQLVQTVRQVLPRP